MRTHQGNQNSVTFYEISDQYSLKVSKSQSTRKECDPVTDWKRLNTTWPLCQDLTQKQEASGQKGKILIKPMV